MKTPRYSPCRIKCNATNSFFQSAPVVVSAVLLCLSSLVCFCFVLQPLRTASQPAPFDCPLLLVFNIHLKLSWPAVGRRLFPARRLCWLQQSSCPVPRILAPYCLANWMMEHSTPFHSHPCPIQLPASLYSVQKTHAPPGFLFTHLAFVHWHFCQGIMFIISCWSAPQRNSWGEWKRV